MKMLFVWFLIAWGTALGVIVFFLGRHLGRWVAARREADAKKVLEAKRLEEIAELRARLGVLFTEEWRRLEGYRLERDATQPSSRERN